MRQTISAVFLNPGSVDFALRRLEMRGFSAEVAGAARLASPHRPRGDKRYMSRPPAAFRKLMQRVSLVSAKLAEVFAAPKTMDSEIVVKVYVDTALEAQAARELIRACGARPTDALGAGWSNWNW